MSKPKNRAEREHRRRRIVQVVFSIIAILVILSWVLSLLVNV